MKLLEKKTAFVVKKRKEEFEKKGWFSIGDVGETEGVFVKTPRFLAEHVAQKIGFQKFSLKFPFYPHNFILFARDKNIINQMLLTSFLIEEKDE